MPIDAYAFSITLESHDMKAGKCVSLRYAASVVYTYSVDPECVAVLEE